jgi:hypothetical protein
VESVENPQTPQDRGFREKFPRGGMWKFGEPVLTKCAKPNIIIAPERILRQNVRIRANLCARLWTSSVRGMWKTVSPGLLEIFLNSMLKFDFSGFHSADATNISRCQAPSRFSTFEK